MLDICSLTYELLYLIDLILPYECEVTGYDHDRDFYPPLFLQSPSPRRRPKLPKSTFLTLCRREITSFCAVVAEEHESSAAQRSLSGILLTLSPKKRSLETSWDGARKWRSCVTAPFLFAFFSARMMERK